MPTVQARIPTGRASRYLVQLCRHVSAIGGRAGHMRFARQHVRRHGQQQHDAAQQVQVEAQWSEEAGVIRFAPYGRCDLEATATELIVRIEAAEGEQLERIQEIVTDRLLGFGRRDRLEIRWQSGDGREAAE